MALNVPARLSAMPWLAAALLAAASACGGSSGGSGDGVDGAASAESAPVGTTAPVGAAATAAPDVTPDVTPDEAPDGGASAPTALPADACTLLAPEQLATLLTNPRPGVGAGGDVGPAGAVACSWSDDDEMTTLDLTIFSMGGEDLSGIDTDAYLRQFLDPEVASRMQSIDIGLGGIAGPDGDDARVQWLAPDGLYDLRLWAVGMDERPGQVWDRIADQMVALASAVAATSGS